jgi:hypothetical protein
MTVSSAKRRDYAPQFPDRRRSLRGVEYRKQNFMPGIKDKVVVITGAAPKAFCERAAE